MIYCFRIPVDATVERLLGAGCKHSDGPRAARQERDKDDTMEGLPVDMASPLKTPNSTSNTVVKSESAVESSVTAHASPIPIAGAFRFGLAPRRLSVGSAGSGKDVKEAEVSPSSM